MSLRCHCDVERMNQVVRLSLSLATPSHLPLYCIVLHCTAMHCTPLHNTAQHSTVVCCGDSSGVRGNGTALTIIVV
jgi:hypothetical protein